jgi:hypothetical protein
VEVAVSCTAVNTDFAPIEAPYASITDPVTGAPDVASVPVRNGIPYYLPRSLVELTVATDKDKNASIAAKPHDIANQKQRYIAYYAPNPFSDDGLCIGRETNGLLSAVYFQGNDRTGDVLLNVVQLAGNIASPPAPQPPLAAPKIPTPAPVSMIIDPTKEQDITSFERRLGPGFRLSIENPRTQQPQFLCPKDSICFATRITVAVRLATMDSLSHRTRSMSLIPPVTDLWMSAERS